MPNTAVFPTRILAFFSAGHYCPTYTPIAEKKCNLTGHIRMQQFRNLYRNYNRFIKNNKNLTADNIRCHLEQFNINISISEKTITHFNIELDGFIIQIENDYAFFPK
jgi:hypothetical protein